MRRERKRKRKRKGKICLLDTHTHTHTHTHESQHCAISRAPSTGTVSQDVCLRLTGPCVACRGAHGHGLARSALRALLPGTSRCGFHTAHVLVPHRPVAHDGPPLRPPASNDPLLMVFGLMCRRGTIDGSPVDRQFARVIASSRSRSWPTRGPTQLPQRRAAEPRATCARCDQCARRPTRAQCARGAKRPTRQP